MADAIYNLPNGANIDTAPMVNSTTETPSKMQQLFSNPNFLSLLAGIGARLDPTGVGGAIGGATQEYMRSRARQDFASSQNARNAPPTQNPLTPEGVAGPTSRTRTENADGTYSTTEKGDVPTSSNSSPEISAAPAAPATRLRRETQLSDLPFLLAPRSPMGDLRGMTAEDVGQAMTAYNEGERLRQANVGQILSGFATEAGIASGESTADLQAAQAAHMREITRGAAEAQAAAAALNRASAGAQLAQVEQAKALGDLPRQVMQAQVDRARDVHGTYTPITMPDGKTVLMTGTEIAQIHTAAGQAAWQKQVHADQQANLAYHVERNKALDINERTKIAAEAKEKILANPSDVAVEGQIDKFNAASNENYICLPPEYGRVWNTPIQRYPIPLVRDGGKTVQLNAYQVSREAARLHITPKEYIDTVLKKQEVGR